MKSRTLIFGFVIAASFFFIQCNNGTSPEPNTPPIAMFTISPTSGSTQTEFLFDASSCSDNEDPLSSLKVRWDWDNDGIWDTPFDTTKIATYKFENDSTNIIALEVKDTGSLTSTVFDTIFISIPFVYYMNFAPGNKWFYNIDGFGGDGYGSFSQGSETWEVLEANSQNDSSFSICLKTTYEGIQISDGFPGSPDTTQIDFWVDTLNIEIVNGSMKLIKPHAFDKFYPYLLVLLNYVLPRFDDKDLCVYQEYTTDGIIEIKQESNLGNRARSDLYYTLQKDIGFKTIDYQESNNGANLNFILELIDYEIKL